MGIGYLGRSPPGRDQKLPETTPGEGSTFKAFACIMSTKIPLDKLNLNEAGRYIPSTV